MYNQEPETVLLLPQLQDDSDVRKDEAGKWNRQPSKAFNDVATSLKFTAPGEVKNISSVPTIWARPLTFEMIIYDQRHSLRSQMVAQWQGMLAAIALAEMRGLPLKAKLLELGNEVTQSTNFGKSLKDLAPKGDRNLYSLDNKNPWQDLYIFIYEIEVDNGYGKPLIEKKPVGMTSPSTLVVPSPEGVWDSKVPWWNSALGMLEAPQRHLSHEEQALLWQWLKNLSQELGRYGGKEEALNIMQGLISEFQRSLTQDTDLEPDKCFSNEEQYFGDKIQRGALIALNKPVKAPPQDSSVQLIPSREKEGKGLPLLLYDPEEMPQVWGVEPQNIWIHDGKNLASLKPSEFADRKERWQKEVILIKKEDLFLQELFFLDLEEALPGALLPDFNARENDPLVFNKRRVTPLIPLNSLLLDYLTPQELVSKITFKSLKTEQGNKIRVILDLPLTGAKSGSKGENYRLYKDYDLKEENCLGNQLPVLQVWPNFRAEGWQEYYAFYYDAELGDRTFRVTIPEARESHRFESAGGNYQMARLNSFPEAFYCADSRSNPMGLILAKIPNSVPKSRTWQVGIDFGTSFTNIFVNLKDTPEKLTLKDLQVQITRTPPDTRLGVLFEYFIPEKFIPVDNPLPISSVLSTRGENSEHNPKQPLFDGRIYVPDLSRFEPKEEWIKTNLKWDENNLVFNELFIRHLALHITALAAETGVSEIQWSLSYPSAFSKRDRLHYVSLWQSIVEELQPKTGIKQNYPEIDSDYLKTESLAIAQYFRDDENNDLVFSTCIDLGGGTSDISIWEKNKLLHQCSVQLAGRDIFSQFLHKNPAFMEKRFNINLAGWKNLRETAFNAKVDVWLRLESENWLKKERMKQQGQEDLQGLVTLTAIGIAGLYYYIGLILKVLREEKKHERQQITSAYIGGNGSRFLQWLDGRGKFDQQSEVNELLSRMLSVGSGFEDTKKTTQLTKKRQPKDEVACGLVLKDTRLEGIDIRANEPVITGEKCVINEKITLKPHSRLQLPEEDDEIITSFTIPELVELPKFLYEFHKALKDLKIEEIKALPANVYKRSLDPQENSVLWDEVKTEIENILLEKVEGKKIEDVRWDPSFIFALKALLRVLGKKWADRSNT
jgi:hypothetical protein